VIEIIRIALLASHLLLVDVAMAGPLVCILLHWRARHFSAPETDDVARRLATLSMACLGAGFLLGGLLLALRWLSHGSYFEAASVIPASRYWFGLAELAFYFACMVIYRGLWSRLQSRPLLHSLVALAASLNLIVHFPALFTIISVLLTRPEHWAQPLDRAGYWQMLVDGEVISRVVHVWLSSAAVTGVTLMWLSSRVESLPQRTALIKLGAKIALAALVAQLPVGVWVALELPEASRNALLGNNLAASVLFGLSLLLVLQLLHTLAAIALGEIEPPHVRRAAAITAVLVLLMVAARSQAEPRLGRDQAQLGQAAALPR
jgi:hypothetical protein